MEVEIEAKWLTIDREEMRAALRAAGASLLVPERLMRRKVYDYPDKRLGKIGGWIRVRDEGGKITMSYKQLKDRTLHGTKEVNIEVDTFASACNFLEAIGMQMCAFQETKRESWTLDGAEVEIDTWPWVPSLVEIEAKSEDIVRKTAKKLGLAYEKALHGSVEPAYTTVYDVTEDDVNSWSEITFGDIPDWLEQKRRV